MSASIYEGVAPQEGLVPQAAQDAQQAQATAQATPAAATPAAVPAALYEQVRHQTALPLIPITSHISVPETELD